MKESDIPQAWIRSYANSKGRIIDVVAITDMLAAFNAEHAPAESFLEWAPGLAYRCSVNQIIYWAVEAFSKYALVTNLGGELYGRSFALSASDADFCETVAELFKGVNLTRAPAHDLPPQDGWLYTCRIDDYFGRVRLTKTPCDDLWCMFHMKDVLITRPERVSFFPTAAECVEAFAARKVTERIKL